MKKLDYFFNFDFGGSEFIRQAERKKSEIIKKRVLIWIIYLTGIMCSNFVRRIDHGLFIYLFVYLTMLFY